MMETHTTEDCVCVSVCVCIYTKQIVEVMIALPVSVEGINLTVCACLSFICSSAESSALHSQRLCFSTSKPFFPLNTSVCVFVF